MKLDLAFAATTAGIMLAMSLATSPAGAGGSFDDDEHPEDGLSYFGFVRDSRGLGVAEARVTAEIKGGNEVVTRTDIVGVYRLPMISKDIKPDDITISCAKDGYKQTRVLQRTDPGPGVKAFEVECTLQKN
jgi:hypothetical protein